MSSIQSEFATKLRTATKFCNIMTPGYDEVELGNNNTPIPFIIIKETLDIAITSSSVQTFINNGNTPNQGDEYQAKMMGGKKLITSLGPNMITYIRNLINTQDILGAPYDGELLIYIKPVMTKVQIAQPNNVNALIDSVIFGINDQAPTSDEYIGGEFSNNYYSSWVFYSPLTVRYVSSASTTGYRYITFTTDFTED
jgi:hypothetical protein